MGASYLISTGFTLAIFVNLLFGFLMDRFHRWKVMAALAGLGMLGGIAMTSHDLLVFRIGTAMVLALGHAGIQQSYTLAADVLRGRETGNVMGVVSMVAGVFSYLGPQMLGLLRDWSGGFVAGWYFIIGAAAVTLLLVMALWSYSTRATRQMATVAGVLLAILLAAPRVLRRRRNIAGWNPASRRHAWRGASIRRCSWAAGHCQCIRPGEHQGTSIF